MNDTLYSRITTAKESESFRDIFQALNLNGFQYLEEVSCDDDTRNKIVRYVAYCYSFQSQFVQTSKDRQESKEKVVRKVGLDPNDKLTKSILNLHEENVNQYVQWYLDENEDPLWTTYVSGLDFVSDQMRFVREGLHIVYTGDNARGASNFIKSVKKDSELKAKAYFNARQAIDQLAADKKELDKRNSAIEKIIKEEVPDFLDRHMNIQEYMVARFRKKNTQHNGNKTSLANYSLPKGES